MNRLIVFIFFIISSITFSQKSDASFSKPYTTYQIGIPANRVVNSVFPTDKNSFLLESRLRKNARIHYRLGVDYNFETNESGSYRGGVKFGFDKLFKTSGKWCFYYGIDLGYKHTYLKDSKKHNGSVLLSPLLGIMYKFSKNFSISTEPNLFFATNFTIDNATFAKNNKDIWFESGLGKIGFLQVNFHF